MGDREDQEEKGSLLGSRAGHSHYSRGTVPKPGTWLHEILPYLYPRWPLPSLPVTDGEHAAWRVTGQRVAEGVTPSPHEDIPGLR